MSPLQLHQGSRRPQAHPPRKADPSTPTTPAVRRQESTLDRRAQLSAHRPNSSKPISTEISTGSRQRARASRIEQGVDGARLRRWPSQPSSSRGGKHRAAGSPSAGGQSARSAGTSSGMLECDPNKVLCKRTAPAFSRRPWPTRFLLPEWRRHFLHAPAASVAGATEAAGAALGTVLCASSA